MTAPPFVPITVRCDGVTYVAVSGETLRFGRHPDDNEIVIGSARRGGEEDTLVSRRAGVVAHLGEQLSIRNDATFEHIEVTSDDHAGRARQLAPGDELRVSVGPLTVAIPGRIRRYILEITPDGASPAASTDPVVDAVAPTVGPLMMSAARRLDVAALCVPLLTTRGRPATPATYAEAAAHRGITRKALEKRIEHLIGELRRDGRLPGLEPGANAKDVLCHFAVRSATVTVDDLAGLNTDG